MWSRGRRWELTSLFPGKEKIGEFQEAVFSCRGGGFLLFGELVMLCTHQRSLTTVALFESCAKLQM